MNNSKQQNEILENLGKENLHYPSGPACTKSHKSRALLCRQDEEFKAIYNLVESHAPNLRFTAVCRYEKASEPLKNGLPLNKTNVDLQCSTVSSKSKIKNIFQQLSEMPGEWTIVQLTSQHNKEEALEVNSEKLYTNPLHLTVFNCGKSQILPLFTISIDQPKDKISGRDIEIRQEMKSILVDNVKRFQSFKMKPGKFYTYAEKEAYMTSRFHLNSRLENLVKEIQNKYLGEWRCLLIGKFVDNKVEKMIESHINEIYKTEKCFARDYKNKSLLKCIIKGGNHLNITEIKKAVRYVFPKDEQNNLRLKFTKMIKNIASKCNTEQQKRHPLILIIDEKLDFLPWEMIDTIKDHPVSRMPSLHFTYALFKEHEHTIVNGWKVISSKGTYIVNPGLDLKQMQMRLSSFFNYWLPEWSGLAGVTPSESDFQTALTSSDIFVYSGHGSGTQFLAGEKIQKLRVGAVVLLFGCNSVQLSSFGPQVEMSGSYQMYMVACSPCVIGMLWEVSDIDTDSITTEFLSQCLPSKASTHWKFVDKKKWATDGSLSFNKESVKSKCEEHEPELLSALSKAKKAAKSYLIQAACVARGLPVRIN